MNLKTIKKLEIGASIATSLTVLLCFFLFIGFIFNREGRPADAKSFTIILLSVWICSLMVAISAYFNTIQRSNIALVILFLGTSFIIIILGFLGLFILIWGGLLPSLLFFIPAVLSIITIVLAIPSRKKLEL